MTKITITLEDQLEAWLQRVSAEMGLSPEEAIKDILRRQADVEKLRDFREKARPYAEKAGIQSDEDVYRIVKESRRRRRSGSVQ